jgi:hypothetical protein
MGNDCNGGVFNWFGFIWGGYVEIFVSTQNKI